MTSLYQVTLRGKVVETVTPKKKKVKRWFYIDIRKALDPTVDREEAIVGVPEDRIVTSGFRAGDRSRSLDAGAGVRSADVSRRPRSSTGTSGRTASTSTGAATEHESVREEFRAFKQQVLENFKYYRVPVIALDRSTRPRKPSASSSRR